jgi:ubiquinone/menaquinone biosynthesis C-methylase UbiE
MPPLPAAGARVSAELPQVSPAKEAVRVMFDDLASEYVEERERQPSFLAQKRIVVDMLSGLRGRLLEAGCGPAPMFDHFLACGFDEVHGIDVSPEMIRQGEERLAHHPLAERCALRLADLENLPYADATFDVVVAMGVFEYLSDYGAALGEIRRVLRRGGHVILTVPNRASAYHLARSSYINMRRLLRARRSENFAGNPCIPWSLDRQLAAAGMDKVASSACNFIFFPLKEVSERVSSAVSARLAPLSRTPLAPLLGAQYIVKAIRR